MSANTNIAWCDSTFNPWIGCTKVGPGCDNCYAKADFDDRKHRVVWGPGQARSRTKTWGDPVKWNAEEFWQCEDCGLRAGAKAFAKLGHKGDCPHYSTMKVRRRVFCASLADVFDNEVDPQWRADLFALIEKTPNLDWLLLTKRIGNVGNMLPVPFDFDRLYPNVWLGATVVNQEEADRDIPKLRKVPARVHFLSMEPLLGPVDLRRHLFECCGEFDTGAQYMGQTEQVCCGCPLPRGDIDWVIAGGESGPGARPSHPDWYRSLREQCAAADVPFLFKQWGEWGEPDSIELTGIARHGWYEDSHEDGGRPRHEWPGPVLNGMELKSQRPEVFQVGKKATGRLLDGIEHNGFPS